MDVGYKAMIGCGCKLSWSGGSFALCANCEEELENAKALPVDPAGFRASQYLAAASGRYHYDCLPRYLDYLGYDSAALFIEAFSKVAAIAAGEVCPSAAKVPSQMYVESTDPALDTWLSRGLDLMILSPEGLTHVLKRAMEAAPRLSGPILADIAAASRRLRQEPPFVWTVELALAA